MMKKLLWIPALVLALALSGCGKTAARPASEEDRTAPQEAGPVSYEDAHLTDEIHYPRLTEFPGELLMDYINQSLAQPAQDLEALDTPDGKSLSYEISRCDSTWVSVLYTRTLKAPDGSETRTLTAVNLEGGSGEEVTIDNAFRDKGAVLEMLETQPGDAALSFYLNEDGAVFFFRPGDDPTRDYVAQTISYSSLEGHWNEFGQSAN